MAAILLILAAASLWAAEAAGLRALPVRLAQPILLAGVIAIMSGAAAVAVSA